MCPSWIQIIIVDVILFDPINEPLQTFTDASNFNPCLKIFSESQFYYFHGLLDETPFFAAICTF
mgnify:CR=1 FL=1